MERDYTQKTRAKRISLDYFKQSHPLRRWRFMLSWGAVIVSLAWVGAAGLRGDHRMYTSGPVSTAHMMFGMQCKQCHVPEPIRTNQRVANEGGVNRAAAAYAYWMRVSDAGCEKCHAGPVHQPNQTDDPTCGSCHVEHQGAIVLADVGDQQCLQCHTNLQTRDNAPTAFDRRIDSFTDGHPEFAVQSQIQNQTQRVRMNDKQNLADSAQIKLNHRKHFKIGLKGLEELKANQGMYGLIQNAKGLQLNCTFCHVADGRQDYMKPIDFVQHCLSCHPLDFDPRLPDASVPHDEPYLVRATLRQTFTDAFETCQPYMKKPASEADASAGAPPSESSPESPQASPAITKHCQNLGLLQAAEDGGRRRSRRRGLAGRRGRRREPAAEAPPRRSRRRGLPGRRRAGAAESAKPKGPPSITKWVAAQMKSSEKLVFKQKCEYCHVLRSIRDKLPEVAPTAIPTRWFPYSSFNHGVHRPLTCTECHRAEKSEKTTDVLLPSIATCQSCHSSAGGARTSCVECHVYHDKSKERDFNGLLTTKDLNARAPAPGLTPSATLAAALGEMRRSEAP